MQFFFINYGNGFWRVWLDMPEWVESTLFYPRGKGIMGSKRVKEHRTYSWDAAIAYDYPV